MRKRMAWLLGMALVVAIAPSGSGTEGDASTLPPSAPVGFSVTPATGVPSPTSLDFSPDGKTLYVASFAGSVFAYPVIGGAALGPPTEFLADLQSPLGVLATQDGVFVSDLEPAEEEGGRDTGEVLRARDDDGDGAAEVVEQVIGGLPIGRHNTNGMAIGPDEQLYITNGNSTDSGFGAEGGPPEEPPYSGSLLRVDPTATGLTPQPEMVVGTGWRNVYDVAFFPEGHPSVSEGEHLAAVPMNGPDGQTYSGTTRPRGEDTLSLLDVNDDVVEHFGFPWCLYDRDEGGLDGFTQDPDEGPCPPDEEDLTLGFPEDATVEFRTPSALFGMHVSADGLAFNPGTSLPSAYDHDLFVAEFGNFFGDEAVGHKVVRVTFDDATGDVASVEDFLTGMLPLDLVFGPDGAMWVADLGGTVYRVAAVNPSP